MKKHYLFVELFVVVILLLFAQGTVRAADGDSLHLVPEFLWDKETVYPGGDVAIEVKYTNAGTSPIPADAQVTFHLEIREIGAGENDEIQVVRRSEDIEVPGAQGVLAGQSFSASTEIAAPPEGNYNLVAVLTVNDAAVIEHTELFGVKSALPPGLARLFAGLGMFAAVMAIMAVGTEVVIDSVKFFLGLKQKVTALESLDKLKEELPGQLSELGVSQKTQGSISTLFTELDAALGKLNQALQPLSDARAALAAIQKGQFSSAFAHIKDIEKDLKDLAQKPGSDGAALESQIDTRVDEMKQSAQSGAEQVLARLAAVFKFDPAITDQLTTALNDRISKITKESILGSADYTAELVGGIVIEIQSKGPEWTANWLKGQMDAYLAVGRSEVVGYLNTQIKPVLVDLGFPDAEGAVAGIETQIDGFQDLLQEEAAVYTTAVRNLLDAVEEKRNDMQSPARKIWRRLRKSQYPSFGGTLLAVGLCVGIIVFAVKYIHPPATSPLIWIQLGIAALVLLVFAGVLWLLRNWGPSLGQALTTVDNLVNKLKGKEQHAQKLGEVDDVVLKEIDGIVPTNVAAVLLKREAKHQDEEESRIRILRIISVFIGGILAYALQIDALQLLEEALPGAAKINLNLVTAEQLRSFWPVLNHDLTAGIILSGLAAGAGSKFWRDLLSRLQATKEQAESAAIMLRKAKSSLE